MEEQKLIVGIQEKPSSIGRWIILSLQHVFAMFGATILVPLITGLDVGVALVASGIGTLIYIASTRGKVPVYLGSSFAYMSTITLAVTNTGGFESAYIGLMVVGIIYMVIATIISFVGSNWIKKLLPPVVIGPMIIIIGMSLAPVAVGSIGLDGSGTWREPLVALITFMAVVLFSMLGKGFIKIVPFLLAILVGYAAAMIFGLVDYSIFETVKFFQVPNFKVVGFNNYNWDFSQVLVFAPLAFVTIAEHIGDHVVLGEVTNKDFITDPGLHKTILGDGLATFVSGALGGPANTTYGENTGVIAITKVGSVWVIGLAAIFAISLGFFGYIQAFISSIPWAVIGGMTVILYGLIASNGVKVLIKDKTDLGKMRNLIVVSAMLVLGLGGASIQITSTAALSGMSLAAIVGICLNQLLAILDKK